MDIDQQYPSLDPHSNSWDDPSWDYSETLACRIYQAFSGTTQGAQGRSTVNSAITSPETQHQPSETNNNNSQASAVSNSNTLGSSQQQQEPSSDRPHQSQSHQPQPYQPQQLPVDPSVRSQTPQPLQQEVPSFSSVPSSSSPSNASDSGSIPSQNQQQQATTEQPQYPSGQVQSPNQQSYMNDSSNRNSPVNCQLVQPQQQINEAQLPVDPVGQTILQPEVISDQQSLGPLHYFSSSSSASPISEFAGQQQPSPFLATPVPSVDHHQDQPTTSLETEQPPVTSASSTTSTAIMNDVTAETMTDSNVVFVDDGQSSVPNIIADPISSSCAVLIQQAQQQSEQVYTTNQDEQEVLDVMARMSMDHALHEPANSISMSNMMTAHTASSTAPSQSTVPASQVVDELMDIQEDQQTPADTSSYTSCAGQARDILAEALAQVNVSFTSPATTTASSNIHTTATVSSPRQMTPTSSTSTVHPLTSSHRQYPFNERIPAKRVRLESPNLSADESSQSSTAPTSPAAATAGHQQLPDPDSDAESKDSGSSSGSCSSCSSSDSHSGDSGDENDPNEVPMKPNVERDDQPENTHNRTVEGGEGARQEHSNISGREELNPSTVEQPEDRRNEPQIDHHHHRQTEGESLQDEQQRGEDEGDEIDPSHDLEPIPVLFPLTEREKLRFKS